MAIEQALGVSEDEREGTERECPVGWHPVQGGWAHPAVPDCSPLPGQGCLQTHKVESGCIPYRGLTQTLPQYSPISRLLGHVPQCLLKKFLAVLGVRCCVSRLSLVATSGSYSLVVVCVLLISAASPVAEHGL